MPADATRPYAALGEAALEDRIESDLATIVGAITAERLHGISAIVLGGGYGRGEGGGHRDDNGWRPSNDYDLFVVMKGVPRWRLPALRRRLAALGRRLEKRVGAEVEVAPLRSADLRRLPFNLMWCELLAGCRVIWGPTDALAGAPPMPPRQLPAIEAVHYLCNRGALLLWSQIEEMPADRLWKFVHKAWLAIGAAVLIADQRFEAGYGPRLTALEAGAGVLLPGVPRATLLERSREATSFRLVPGSAPAHGVLGERFDEARRALLETWASVEARRLARPIPDWRVYAAVRAVLPGRYRDVPIGLVNNVRLLRARALRPWPAALEHPRGRVVRALPGLLADREPRPDLAALLAADPTSWEDQARRCLELWRRT